MTNLFLGLSYNWRGLSFLAANRRLWPLVVIPFTLNILALGLFVVLILNWQGEVFSFLAGSLGGLDVAEPQGFWQHTADAALWGLRFVMQIFIFLASLIVIVMGVYLVSLIVSGPFYEMLSERVLVIRGVRFEMPFASGRFAREVVHAIKTEIVKALFFIAVGGVLFLLSWIPLIGLFFAVAQFVFSCWFFAWGLSLYPFVMERRPIGEMLRWGRSRAMTLIGFGLPAALPVLGLFLMSIQVVGGSLLYCDLKGESA